jgi:hypothetical protein
MAHPDITNLYSRIHIAKWVRQFHAHAKVLSYKKELEEMEKVNPDLVVRDKEGKPYYDQVNAMLLNESLKEHRKVEEQSRKVQEQEATIAQLRQDVRASVAELNARLKEQDSKIEKVSAQVEMTRPATQMAVNDQ